MSRKNGRLLAGARHEFKFREYGGQRQKYSYGCIQPSEPGSTVVHANAGEDQEPEE